MKNIKTETRPKKRGTKEQYETRSVRLLFAIRFFSLVSIQPELIDHARASFLAINKSDGSISQGKCSIKNVLFEIRGPANLEKLVNPGFSGRKTASSRNFEKG